MIIVLGLMVVVVIICYLISREEYSSIRHHTDFTIRTFRFTLFYSAISCPVTLAIIFALFLGGSYDSYLDIRTFYDSTIEQYSTAVEMYQDKAVIDVESAAWTDLKYQGYQSNISKSIALLRGKIIDYNEKLISKRIMKENLFFNWLIVPPDDYMKILKMKTASQH